MDGNSLKQKGDNMLSKEEIQELIDLTPKQEKVWAQLKRAINACRKNKVYFYQVLESLYGLNGNNVERIEEEEFYYHMGIEQNKNANLQMLDYPGVNTACSWADDTHYVIVKKPT